MTKGKLIKFLEPFDDNVEIMVAAKGLEDIDCEIIIDSQYRLISSFGKRDNEGIVVLLYNKQANWYRSKRI